MSFDPAMLSVIVPIYNERPILHDLAQRLRAVFDRLPFNAYEAVLVSDGSTDGSEQVIAELARENSNFRGVFLTRNFGHQAAVSVGLAHAKGSVVCVIDGDLQDPPEVIPELIDTLARGSDVAYAVRRQRKEGLLQRLAYHSFYRLLRAVSSIDIPLDAGDFCAMTRPVVDDMLELPDRTRFVRGLRAWVGYRQVGVEYERHARAAGQPKYGLKQLAELAYDGLFSFSNLPVKLMQFFGFIISTLAMCTAGGYFGWHLLFPGSFPIGWATLVISMWFLGGIQLLFMGLLGEYVFRTFDETRHRPTALVRELVTHSNTQASQERSWTPITPKLTHGSTGSTGGGEHENDSFSTRSAA